MFSKRQSPNAPSSWPRGRSNARHGLRTTDSGAGALFATGRAWDHIFRLLVLWCIVWLSCTKPTKIKLFDLNDVSSKQLIDLDCNNQKCITCFFVDLFYICLFFIVSSSLSPPGAPNRALHGHLAAGGEKHRTAADQGHRNRNRTAEFYHLILFVSKREENVVFKKIPYEFHHIYVDMVFHGTFEFQNGNCFTMWLSKVLPFDFSCLFWNGKSGGSNMAISPGSHAYPGGQWRQCQCQCRHHPAHCRWPQMVRSWWSDIHWDIRPEVRVRSEKDKMNFLEHDIFPQLQKTGGAALVFVKTKKVRPKLCSLFSQSSLCHFGVQAVSGLYQTFGARSELQKVEHLWFQANPCVNELFYNVLRAFLGSLVLELPLCNCMVLGLRWRFVSQEFGFESI